MILQIANRKANVSTNDISRTRQQSTCQSQLLGMGEEETKIKSKYTLHKHKYKCMILHQKQSVLFRSVIVPHSCLQVSFGLTSLNMKETINHPLHQRKRWALKHIALQRKLSPKQLPVTQQVIRSLQYIPVIGIPFWKWWKTRPRVCR